MGETRETRIKEFHAYNTQPVIGLREGSWIEVKDEKLTLRGNLEARIFEYGKSPYEIETNSDEPKLVCVSNGIAAAIVNPSAQISKVLVLADLAWKPDDNEMNNVEFSDYDFNELKKKFS